MHVRDFELEYGSILRMKINNENYTTQFLSAKDTLYFDFYFKGHPVRTIVYDDRQFAQKKYMGIPVPPDLSKKLIS